MYWSIKNCEGSAERIKSGLDAITKHYQNDHSLCNAASRCKQQNYVCSRILIKNSTAVALLEKCIQGLYIYKHPGKYIHSMDTHYVESFNNAVLMYIDKRVHYHNSMYNIRIGLAILDWNENVDRPACSVNVYTTARNQHQRSPTRNLSPKLNAFTSTVWKCFCQFVRNNGDDEIDIEN